MNWKIFLKELLAPVRFISWRGRRAAFLKGKEITDILEGLSRFPIGVHQDRDLPREEFRGAVQRYVLGIYEDSMYHSSFSIEMGLIVRLNEKLEHKEKIVIHEAINRRRNPQSFTFGRIKNLSEERRLGILKKNTIKAVDEILEIRNSHIHAQNFISATIIQSHRHLKRDSRFEQQIEMALKREPAWKRFVIRFLLRRFLKLQYLQRKKTIESMSDFRWCARDNILNSVIDDIENYFEEAASALQELLSVMGKFDVIKLRDAISKFYGCIHPDSYMKKRALKVLRTTYTILQDIEIL